MPTHPRRRRRGAYSPRRRWPIGAPGQAGQFTHIQTIPNYESDAFTDEQQDEEASEPTFKNPSYETTLAEQPTMDYHLNHNRDSPGADGSFAARARAGLRLSRSNSRELRDGERLPSVPVSLGGLMKFKPARRSNRSGRIVEHPDLSDLSNEQRHSASPASLSALGSVSQRPSLDQYPSDAQMLGPSFQEEIQRVFGCNLPDPVELQVRVGERDGELLFIQHPNRDVSAYEWDNEKYVWMNIGLFSHTRKKIEGQLASERLRGQKIGQFENTNTLDYFHAIARQREASGSDAMKQKPPTESTNPPMTILTPSSFANSSQLGNKFPSLFAPPADDPFVNNDISPKTTSQCLLGGVEHASTSNIGRSPGLFQSAFEPSDQERSSLFRDKQGESASTWLQQRPSLPDVAFGEEASSTLQLGTSLSNLNISRPSLPPVRPSANERTRSLMMQHLQRVAETKVSAFPDLPRRTVLYDPFQGGSAASSSRTIVPDAYTQFEPFSSEHHTPGILRGGHGSMDPSQYMRNQAGFQAPLQSLDHVMRQSLEESWAAMPNRNEAPKVPPGLPPPGLPPTKPVDSAMRTLLYGALDVLKSYIEGPDTRGYFARYAPPLPEAIERDPAKQNSLFDRSLAAPVRTESGPRVRLPYRPPVFMPHRAMAPTPAPVQRLGGFR